jgi:UDP-N-acetylmuramate--alanine ligase
MADDAPRGGSNLRLPQALKGVPVYLVGIKGQGMTALAEILNDRGARIGGSDVAETFYTDSILKRLGLTYHEGFDARHIDEESGWVIHSPAYDRESHPELRAALSLGLPVLSYPEALGQLSQQCDFAGVSGMHGKTTTAALTGVLVRALRIPATVMAGGEVADFGGRSTIILGDRYLVAEACEYRRHFLNYHPDFIIVTSVEEEHLDYFTDLADILDAFKTFVLSLPPNGTFIYCADDRGAAQVASVVSTEREDLKIVPYGMHAEGDYGITELSFRRGAVRFALRGFSGDIELHTPGRHTALNATAALALVHAIQEKLGSRAFDEVRGALRSFRGTRRRSEVVGEAGGVLFMEDYGHHPTEIRTTLEGLREFLPDRRIVVDFMPHTYTRTRALLEDFGKSFQDADEVLLHRIYASAREATGDVSGEHLFREVARHGGRALYFHEPDDAEEYLLSTLGEGDLFITMGAGDNWKLGRKVLKRIEETQ